MLEKNGYPGLFAKDCTVSINQGATVTYIAMQLSYYMGFKKIGIVGCDHLFTTKGTPHKTVISGEIDENHFDPRYFSNDDQWQLTDLTISDYQYKITRDVFESDRRKIINITDSGRLDVFERMPLDQFIEL